MPVELFRIYSILLGKLMQSKLNLASPFIWAECRQSVIHNSDCSLKFKGYKRFLINRLKVLPHFRLNTHRQGEIMAF